jgi:hypothetical protein
MLLRNTGTYQLPRIPTSTSSSTREPQSHVVTSNLRVGAVAMYVTDPYLARSSRESYRPKETFPASHEDEATLRGRYARSEHCCSVWPANGMNQRMCCDPLALGSFWWTRCWARFRALHTSSNPPLPSPQNQPYICLHQKSSKVRCR